MTRGPRHDVDEELDFHLEERTRDYIARGMSAEAAREAAARRVGDTARVRDACASAASPSIVARARRPRLGVSWLDVKLGLRMFAKSPGLSLVAVAGMAVAIALGGGYFSLVGSFLDSTVPIENGDRVVMIRNRYVDGPAATGTVRVGDAGATAFDFRHWRDEVATVVELSAFRDGKRNLITDDGQAQLIRVAEVTASGLALTRTAAHLGRTLLPDDERADVPAVVVISYDQWQRRFSSDPAVLGTTVRLGASVHTIVGVMPSGFAFPIRHDAWVPMRVAELDAAAGAGPLLHVFGRLADGRSLTEAKAELAVIGDAVSAAFPATHLHARPEVRPFAQTIFGIEGPAMQLGLRSLQFGTALLLLIVAVNVAVLVYARTATRFGEIAVRTALGASRARVVMQLFVEALVLSVAAAVLGLFVLYAALATFRDYLKTWPDRPDWWPYWLEPSVSPQVVVYAGVLAVLAAVLIGVLPALKATGGRVQASLQQFSSRGAGMQLGRTWTAMIVLQVAMAVAVLPGAISKTEGLLRLGTVPPAAGADTLVKGFVLLPEPRGGERVRALLQRLGEEPEVSAVTFATNFPGTEPQGVIEPEDGSPLIHTRAGLVAPNLFDVFDVPLLAGRGLTAADARPSASAVIVDRAFAERLAPGGSAIGRRIRFTAPDGASAPNPWLEIVGVVPVFAPGFTASGDPGPPPPSLYKAAAPGDAADVTLIVRTRTRGAARDGQWLQKVAASVDPAMGVEFVAGVADQWHREQEGMRMVATIVVAVNASVLLLSAAGIHAMMAFTVARRRREIGIRVALGADARRVLAGIFGRAAAQIGIGLAAGLTLAGLVAWLTSPGAGDGGPGAAAAANAVAGVAGGGISTVVLFPLVAVLMSVVGLLAAAGPARRGLAVAPTEALRNE